MSADTAKAQCREMLAISLALLLVGCARLPATPDAQATAVSVDAPDPGLVQENPALAFGAADWFEPVASTEVREGTHAPTIYYSPDIVAPPAEPATMVAQLPPVAEREATAAPTIYYFQEDPAPATPTALAPTATAPVAPAPVSVQRMPASTAGNSFTIGAGDTVQLDVLGRPELSARGNVSGDGRVTAALIGAVPIAGLTPVEAADRIAAAYRTGQYLVAPQVTVTLLDYQSQQLTVLGEVHRPGRFALRTRLSVLDALALSGGITELGSSMVYLLRPQDGMVTRHELDLDALIEAGAGQQFFELFADDIVVVPKAEVFYIYGEVRNPNSYKLKPGITVIQALSLAGGLTDKGSDRRIDIRRQLPDGELLSESASLNDPLRADDVIYVRERLF